MNLVSISINEDNYIWLLYNNDKNCIIVDPGEFISIHNICKKKKLTPVAIFLTHHHHDHVDGVESLKTYFNTPVYGPKETIKYGTTKIVKEGDEIFLLNKCFKVFELPGHTLGHVGFYSPPWFFCGDTLFSAGCGRLFEGSAKDMYFSIKKINSLPPNTLICAGHEYTLQNLNFAISVFPKNTILSMYKKKVEKLNFYKKPTLPSALYLERQINIFLNPYNFEFKGELKRLLLQEEWVLFKKLRDMKNNFIY
ncbi:gloB [Wigglesworthia glossinidia endosymbiont of Glossina brevipalpis]|uniref:Hydroxyacylglutathione hydrolase n=1 Tax=Wigglesworthia glossinidia brevipalpis TaxID=36870 RepID=GLO2_WIGBR|nr:RecName: Full=Hydroxyacylglutathione hydrolase; AltName: Full=Glyoxalase II; Short=Glx II [Wigglesworthia glossinidia endosymbiont of Glossina brevipalpis]BAC24213.1 gloB [Wigglesworthia glossinidia endosymbiont of Glossina brevipalpis]